MERFLTVIKFIFTAWINMQIIFESEQMWNENLSDEKAINT